MSGQLLIDRQKLSYKIARINISIKQIRLSKNPNTFVHGIVAKIVPLTTTSKNKSKLLSTTRL
jgi:hypothetical protein